MSGTVIPGTHTIEHRRAGFEWHIVKADKLKGGDVEGAFKLSTIAN